MQLKSDFIAIKLQTLCCPNGSCSCLGPGGEARPRWRNGIAFCIRIYFNASSRRKFVDFTFPAHLLPGLRNLRKVNLIDCKEVIMGFKSTHLASWKTAQSGAFNPMAGGTNSNLLVNSSFPLRSRLALSSPHELSPARFINT